MTVPILGSSGPTRPGEIYIPGRKYLLHVKLATGDELTAEISFNIPPDKVPNPWVPEKECAQAASVFAAQRSATRSVEGPWFFWPHVVAFQYEGPVE